MKKQFSKFQIASFKRTAQNVYPLVRERNKLINTLKETAEALESVKRQIDAYQTPIKEATGGFTTDDLVVREVIDTGKVDKNGNPIKQTVFKLKYPETIIPETTEPVEENIIDETTVPEEPATEQQEINPLPIFE